jgi:hypothetical protein
MTFNPFPSNPIDGQTWTNPLGTQYRYDATRTAWLITGQVLLGITGVQGVTGLANFLDQADYPTGFVKPELLFNEDDNVLVAGIEGSDHWVQISAGSSGGPTGLQGTQGLTGLANFLDRTDYPAGFSKPELLFNETDNVLVAGVQGSDHWVQISSGSAIGNVCDASYIPVSNGSTYVNSPLSVDALKVIVGPGAATQQLTVYGDIDTAGPGTVHSGTVYGDNFDYGSSDYKDDVAPAATTGYRINNTAPVGHYLRGDGEHYTDSTICASDLPGGSWGSTGPQGATGPQGFTGVQGTTGVGLGVSGALTAKYVPYCSDSSGPVLADSPLYTDGTNMGLRYTAPLSALCVNGGVNIGGQNSTETDGLRLSVDSTRYFGISICNDTTHGVFSTSLGMVGTGGSLNINGGDQAVVSANTQMDLYCPSVSVLGTLNVGSIDPAGTGETLRLTNSSNSAKYASMSVDSTGNMNITTQGEITVFNDFNVVLSSSASNNSLSFYESTLQKAHLTYYGTTYSSSLARGLVISTVNNLTLVSGGITNSLSETHLSSGVAFGANGRTTNSSNGGSIDFYCNTNHTLIWSTVSPSTDLVVTIADTPAEGAIIFIHSFNQNDCVAIHIGGNVIYGCCGYNQRSCMIKYANSVWCKVSDYLGAA